MLGTLLFWLRLLLVAFWFAVTSLTGFVLLIVRWGKLDLNSYYGRMLAYGVSRLTGLRAEVEGWEHLHAHQPCVYVGNHQTNMDATVYGRIYPRKCVLIGKKEVLWLPLFGLFFYGARNILIDRKKRVSAIASLDQAVAIMKKRGASIWIFAEGTRNGTDQALLPFKKGAFYMAIQAGVPIVPLVSESFKGHFEWKKRIFRATPHRIRILPPVPTTGLTTADVDSLSLTVREKILEVLAEWDDPRLKQGDRR